MRDLFCFIAQKIHFHVKFIRKLLYQILYNNILNTRIHRHCCLELVKKNNKQWIVQCMENLIQVQDNHIDVH